MSPTLSPNSTAATGVYPHSHDHGTAADLRRLAEPGVEIGGTEVEVRVAAVIKGALQENLGLAVEPRQMRLTSEREMPASEPIEANKASTLRAETPLTQASMIPAYRA